VFTPLQSYLVLQYFDGSGRVFMKLSLDGNPPREELMGLYSKEFLEAEQIVKA